MTQQINTTRIRITFMENQRISYVDKRIPVLINTIYSEKIPIEKSKSIKES